MSRASLAARQAAPHEGAQEPMAQLHLGNGVLIEPGGDTEDDTARRSGLEHALDDQAVEV